MGDDDIVFGSHASVGVLLATAMVLAPLGLVIGLLSAFGLPHRILVVGHVDSNRVCRTPVMSSRFCSPYPWNYNP